MTTTDPAARLRAATAEHIAQGRLSAPWYAEADVTAVLDELEQLRAEREGWFNGAAQRLRHAYRSGWDDRGEAMTAALGSIGGFTEAERRAAAYVAEWWGTPGVWPLPPEQPQAERDAAAKFAMDMERLEKNDPAGAQWLKGILAERVEPEADTDSCIHCGRDFSLPYVTRQTGSSRCEDCTATCGFPGCGHPDHQRADCSELLAAERDADVRAVAAFLTHFREDPDSGVLDEYGGDALTIGMLRRMVAALDARKPDPSGGA